MQIVQRFVIGLFLSGIIGYFSFRRKSLSTSGVLGLLISGSIIYAAGELAWYLPMIAFLISSSLWTLYKHSTKKFMAEIIEKNGPRDIFQAAANVGVPTIIATIVIFQKSDLFVIAFLSALAAVNADTWATELGVLSKNQPRLITSWKKVPSGTSGGITLQGTLAGLSGSFFISLFIFGFLPLNTNAGVTSNEFIAPACIVFLSGAIGLVIDSILGATIQASFKCSVCGAITEKLSHHGPSTTQHFAGLKWLNNDWVNFICALSGALSGIVLYTLIVG